MSIKKPADALTIDDFREFAIWKYTNADMDETMVSPIERIPVSDLCSCVVGTRLTLNNGTTIWGVLCNIDLNNAFKTSQLLALSVFHSKGMFHLANYFEVGYEERSPARLAELFNLSIDDAFPISYDISRIAIGDETILRAKIYAEPSRRLSEDEIMRLAVG